VNGRQVDLHAVNGTSGSDAGVEHGARLLAFTEAVMRKDDEELVRQRQMLRSLLPDESFVDACAVIGAFNVVDRIADATGIPLDGMLQAVSADIREELNLTRFGSSANTRLGS
jgi:hypothetical protein